MQRSLLLDSLRILAIVLVIIAHTGQLLGHESGAFFGWKNIYFVSLGGVGVTLFLVLSGVLAGLARPVPLKGYAAYLFKKVQRIYPLYWIFIPLAMFGYALSDGLLQGDMPDLFPNGVAVDLAGSLTGFYAWWGLWGGPYNPPSWYISLIMSLYMLAPALAYLLNRWALPTLLILFCVSLASRWYVGQWGLPFLDISVLKQVEGWLYRQYGFMPGRPGDWFPPCRLFEFGLGIYLALKLPHTAWQSLKLPLTGLVRKLSDLSFPLFLVHYPFLFLVETFRDMGITVSLAISLYLGLMLLLAECCSRLEVWLLGQVRKKKRVQSVHAET